MRSSVFVSAFPTLQSATSSGAFWLFCISFSLDSKLNPHSGDEECSSRKCTFTKETQFRISALLFLVGRCRPTTSNTQLYCSSLPRHFLQFEFSTSSSFFEFFSAFRSFSALFRASRSFSVHLPAADPQARRHTAKISKTNT